MKMTKRLAAMAAAMVMAATMCAGGYIASAAPETSGSTLNVDTSNDNANHTYTAFQIFTGSYSDDSGLVISDWAADFNSVGLLADQDFLNMEIEGVKIGDSIGASSTADEVARVLEKISSKSDEATQLAKILAKYAGGSGSDISNNKLNAGYWLIKDSYEKAGTAGEATNDAVSLYLLKVTSGEGEFNITPKKDVPSLEKKVSENVKNVVGKPDNESDETNAEKWNDVADYCIGDDVPFKLYGTLPDAESYDAYEHYYYKFTDNLGIQFDAPEASDIVVSVNGTPITDPGKNMRVVVDSNKITVTFEDIKEFAPNSTDIITVEYSAVLNSTAEIGLPGQENTAFVTYSNNPNIEYNPNTSDDEEDTPKDDDNKEQTDDTPKDKVIVFTYQLDVTKQDSITGEKLENAEFVLYRLTDDGGKEYAVLDAANKIKSWTAGDFNGDMEFTGTVTPTTLKSDANGNFSVIGLDDGIYYLKETKAPTGYQLLDDDVKLNITATTANDQNWSGTAGDALTALNIEVAGVGSIGSVETGSVSMTVENAKGTNLPETGGMGTKLFVIGGGLTAGAAGIYLITKKRTKDAE